MESTTAAITYSVASTLLPIAYYSALTCWSRIRDPTKIRKSVLVMPPKSGKTTLKERLNCNELMVIDLDEFIKGVMSPTEEKRLAEFKANNHLHEFELFYKEQADKVYEKIRKQINNNHTKRVLFITSSWLFASQFKADSIYVVCPDQDFHKREILAETTVEERDSLNLQRQYFIDSIPNKRAINSYHNYNQLEEKVRARLKLHHKL